MAVLVRLILVFSSILVLGACSLDIKIFGQKSLTPPSDGSGGGGGDGDVEVVTLPNAVTRQEGPLGSLEKTRVYLTQATLQAGQLGTLGISRLSATESLLQDIPGYITVNAVTEASTYYLVLLERKAQNVYDLKKIDKTTFALSDVTCPSSLGYLNGISVGDRVYFVSTHSGTFRNQVMTFDGTTCSQVYTSGASYSGQFYKFGSEVYVYGFGDTILHLSGTSFTELAGLQYSSMSGYALPFGDKLYFIGSHAAQGSAPYIHKLNTASDTISPVTAVTGSADIPSPYSNDGTYSCGTNLCVGPTEDAFTILSSTLGTNADRVYNFGTRVFYTYNSGATDSLFVINPGDSSETSVAFLEREVGPGGAFRGTDGLNIARSGNYLYYKKKDVADSSYQKMYVLDAAGSLAENKVSSGGDLYYPKSIQEKNGQLYFFASSLKGFPTLYSASGATVSVAKADLTELNPYLRQNSSAMVLATSGSPVVLAAKSMTTYLGYYKDGLYRKVKIPGAVDAINIANLNDNGVMLLAGKKIPSQGMAGSLSIASASNDLWVYDGATFKTLGTPVTLSADYAVHASGNDFYLSSTSQAYKITAPKGGTPSIAAMAFASAGHSYPLGGRVFVGKSDGLFEQTGSTLNSLNATIVNIKLMRKAGDDLLIVAKKASAPGGLYSLFSYRPSDNTLQESFAGLPYTGTNFQANQVPVNLDPQDFKNGTYFVNVTEATATVGVVSNVYRYNPSTRVATALVPMGGAGAGTVVAWKRTANAFYALVNYTASIDLGGGPMDFPMMKIMKIASSGVTDIATDMYGVLQMEVIKNNLYFVGMQLDLSGPALNEFALYTADNSGASVKLQDFGLAANSSQTYWSKTFTQVLSKLEPAQRMYLTSDGDLVLTTVDNANANGQYGTLKLQKYNIASGALTPLGGDALVMRGTLSTSSPTAVTSQASYLNLSGDNNIWSDSYASYLSLSGSVKVLTKSGEVELF